MRKSVWIVCILALVMMLGLSACDGGGGGGNGNGQQGDPNTGRPPAPAPYAGRTNPKANDANAAAQGKELYAINCASCHGAAGHGDGPTAAALDPKPSSLASILGSVDDAYLFWRISEGGAFAPFSSSMPGWKSTLNEDQIWSLVAHIRTMR